MINSTSSKMWPSFIALIKRDLLLAYRVGGGGTQAVIDFLERQFPKNR